MMEQQEHTEHTQNTYVELVLESHDAKTQHTICQTDHTQSQKKRRRFIPFKYHSKIFKASKKKRPVDDHRISSNSSSYASCRTFKKESSKSNVSSNTYQEIESLRCAGPARCNSIASKAPVYDDGDQMNDDRGIPKETPSDFKKNRIAKLFNQMEFPKKTGRHAKKYMGIFCMILVCAIISAAIASIFSTKSLRENIPSDVEHLISKGELKSHIDGLKNEVHNFTDETKINTKYHFDSFSAKEDMEKLSNKTKENTDLLLQILPNNTVGKDMEQLSSGIKKIMELLSRILPNKSVRQDIEELSKKIDKNHKWLLKVLPNKADFDVWTGKEKRILQRIYHATKCVTDCRDHRDGNYQSCFYCDKFVQCHSNGDLEIADCLPSNINATTLYWDDFTKRCESTSRTCDTSYAFKLINFL